MIEAKPIIQSYLVIKMIFKSRSKYLTLFVDLVLWISIYNEGKKSMVGKDLLIAHYQKRLMTC